MAARIKMAESGKFFNRNSTLAPSFWIGFWMGEFYSCTRASFGPNVHPIFVSTIFSQYNHCLLLVERDSYNLALFAAVDHERDLLASSKPTHQPNSLSYNFK
jgi:hypothetical protein